MNKKELLAIAKDENLTIAEVKTILKFSLIIDRDSNLRERHIGSPLIDLWNSILNKKYWLMEYKEQVKRDKRKRKRLI